MTPDQCRAARAYLNWTMRDLGKRAGIANSRICDFENGKVKSREKSYYWMMEAFKEAGIIFLAEGILLLAKVPQVEP